MSLFSSSSQAKQNDRRSRRRSSSEVRYRKPEARSPVISFEETSDVTSAICVELSRLFMIKPNMETGTFFRTMSNSQMDINKSDTTIVISAAILSHIGNPEMRDRLLSKSKSCKKYYEDFGLEKPQLCEMFVTMLFALNPTFVTMLSSSIRISLNRAQDFISNEHDKDRLTNSVSKIVRDGSWSKEEALQIFIPSSKDIPRKLVTEGSFQKTPTEMIHPDESISSVGDIPDYRNRIRTQDMMNFITRKKKGVEPTFSETFRSTTIPRPPLANKNPNRHGIGYKPEEASRAHDSLSSKINNILGSQTTVSYNLDTGTGRSRRPRVEDFLESESIATTALKETPASNGNPWSDPNFFVPSPPSPTEINLPNSVLVDDDSRTVKEMDSYELIRARLAGMDV